jgi:transposase
MPAARRVGTRGGMIASFFEALHYFTVHNITWRALPAEFGSWNSIWKRFWRLSRSGVFETFFEALASLSERAHLVQMFDSTVIRAHVSAAGAKDCGGRGNEERRQRPGQEALITAFTQVP